jgi:hypothetical protein
VAGEIPEVPAEAIVSATGKESLNH